MSYFVQLLSQKAHTLRLPRKYTVEVQRYVLTHQTAATHDRAPFRRQLDFWAFSVATALARELAPLDGPSSKWGDKFVDTRNVEMPKELCDLLAVAAFHQLGAEHDQINDAAQIIEMGNRLAGAGCPGVLEQLGSRDLRLTPLEKALNHAASTLADVVTYPEPSI